MKLSAVTTRVLVAGGAAAAAIAALAAAQNPASATATTVNTVFRQAPVVSLPAVGGTPTTIVSMTVPAGNWVVQSKANAVNWNREDYLRCAVFADQQLVGVGSTAHLGAHPANGGTYVGLLSNLGVLRASAPVAVTLQCSHDFTSTSGAPYIEDGALLATRTGAIDG
jgi:hypothetical protein